MHELFPIISGIVLGLIVGMVRPNLGWRFALPLSVVLGIAATVASGEFRISWGYLLLDIPLVALSCAVTLLATGATMRWLSSRFRVE